MHVYKMAGKKFTNLKVVCFLCALICKCVSLTFEPGKTYKYTYQTVVSFNEAAAAGKDVGYQLNTEFDITAVFHAGETQLLKVQVTSASISSVAREGVQNELVKLLKFPIYFEFSEGNIGRVYTSETESIFCSNLKKGLLSLFQIQETEGQRDEIDVSGECSAYYAVSGGQVSKTKQNCQNIEIAGQFKNVNEMFGVSVDSSYVTHYDVSDGLIRSATGSSRHTAVVNARAPINSAVISIQRLNYKSVSDSTDTSTANSIEEAAQSLLKEKKYRETLLPSETETQFCTENCEKPLSILKALKEDLVKEKLSKIESGKAFIKLLKTFRNAGKSTIEEVLTHSDSSNIVTQLIDIGAATQTPAAQQALMQLLSFTDESAIDYPERFILAAAYSTHPGEYLLIDMLELMKKNVPNDNLRESIALGMGAIVYSYCKNYGRCLEQEVVAEYVHITEDRANSCEDEPCTLMYIRSMGNSGLSAFLQTVLKFAELSTNPTVSLNAVQALRRMPRNIIREETVPVLQLIFHQNKRTYDSSVRIAALELLLQYGMAEVDLRNVIISAMNDQTEFEVSTYIIRRLKDLSDLDSVFRARLQNVLSDKKLNNYNLYAQKGKSSAFTGYLAETRGANCSYGLYQENTKTGVMKKSAMVVNILNKVVAQPLLTFGIYAEGIEALIGDVPEGEESQDATAGLSLTMMDVLLRPVEFFRGTSGLMSAVWNAPSEPVSALQGNLLLQDHSQKIHLSNGLIVDLTVVGVASIDLSGSVSISLWYKNSHSVITNSGALVIEGSMKLDSKELKAGVQFSAETEAFIDFQTDVDFAEMPLKMCLQMKRPPVTFSHFIEKFEKTKHLKKRLRLKRKRISKTSPVSYFINEKNSYMCTIMDPDQ